MKNFLNYSNPKTFRSLLFLSSFLFCLAGCKGGEKKPSVVKENYFEASEDSKLATINSLSSTDVYGRSFGEGDVTSSDRKVGMFYFIWHGEHVQNGIFNVTELKKTNPEALWDINADPTISRTSDFHYFSEPLYGYYCSDDPWVITRHVELLTMMGVDYISFDLTNFALYEKNSAAIFDVLLKYQAQGWKIPLVTSILNGTSVEANHDQRIASYYNTFYKDPKYDSLWLRDPETNKPIITISIDEYYDKLPLEVRQNIKFYNTIWPYDEGQTTYDDLSWLDWEYPQTEYINSKGTLMNVSVAQHCDGSFGSSVNPEMNKYPSKNRGRGYNYETKKNESENAFKGTNLETQWSNVFNSERGIDEVFVTGWNEWIAYKLPYASLHPGVDNPPYDKNTTVDFCDTCDEEYSRDLEMTKGGYGDNFYLQNTRLTRKFKSSNIVKYFGSYATQNLRNYDWQNARTYEDFVGDAMERNFARADKSGVFYTNNTNRNDIASTKVSNDKNNLYIQIQTKDNVVIDETTNNNLNLLLSVDGSNANDWNGYNFILNTEPMTAPEGTTDISAFKPNSFEHDEVGRATYVRNGNTISLCIPLSSLGLTSDEFTVDFKVADGISDPSDIMNYYIDGDSAPIGRLNYRYNSTHR